MLTPLVTWALIVGLFIVILLVRLVRATTANTHRSHLIGFITEREEFYIPGDPNPRKVDEYDYDDIEDL